MGIMANVTTSSSTDALDSAGLNDRSVQNFELYGDVTNNGQITANDLAVLRDIKSIEDEILFAFGDDDMLKDLSYKKEKLDAFKNVHLKYALPYGVYEKIISGVDTFDDVLDITNGVPKITDKLILFWQLQFFGVKNAYADPANQLEKGKNVKYEESFKLSILKGGWQKPSSENEAVLKLQEKQKNVPVLRDSPENFFTFTLPSAISNEAPRLAV